MRVLDLGFVVICP